MAAELLPLALGSRAVVTMDVRISMQHGTESFGCLTRSGIAGSHFTVISRFYRKL